MSNDGTQNNINNNISGITTLFINRPVMTTLVMFAILLFGAAGYKMLAVNNLPNIDFPTIQVTANLPGASPETMASAVATPLEKEFSTIAGLDSMSSTNALGSTQITLQFTLDRDIDAAAQDVQSMISKATRSLPSDMTTPPSYRKVNPADQPVLYLALSSQTLPMYKVNEYADTVMAQRISMVKGVAQVQVYGSQKYAVRINLDPNAMAAKGIGIDEVSKAVDKGNVNSPTGTIDGKDKSYTIQAYGQLLNADSYKTLIAAYRNGAPVRIKDIGSVVDSVENDKQASWYKDTRAIVLAIQRQPGTNTIEVVDAVKKLLPSFKAQIPPSVNLNILYDRTISIRESVEDVQFTLILTIALVVMVIFMFLRNISATIIPALALPMSIVGTFAFMYLMGFSINNLSLMALTLSVGFVVDDAIVMLENIVRHIENGEKPFQAALKGSKEIGFTIISMTISLVAVFIPVLFMKGILGRLLHEFAITISLSILISGFVSLSLTPMLCSRFIRSHKEEKHGTLYMSLEKIFDGMLKIYDFTLKSVVKYKFIFMIFFMVTIGLTAYFFTKIPMGFLPNEDTGQIFAMTEAQQGVSFEQMVKYHRALSEIIIKDPNVEAFMSAVGSGGASNSVNAGRFFITLKPRTQRKMKADDVIKSLRPKLSKIPGIMIFMQNPPPIRIGGSLSKSQYQYTMQSPDISELYSASSDLEKALKDSPILQDVTSDLQIKNPQVNVEILRDRASALGISVGQIEDALYSAYGTRQVSTIYAPNNQYKVMMELSEDYQKDPSAMSMLYITSSSGQLVQLSSVAKISKGLGPLSINHFGQLPSVTVSFNLKEGVSLGDAAAFVEKTAKSILSQSISGSFQGTAQAFQSSTKGLWMLILVAILVIYIVLGILYESFIHPITILSGLPSAGLGAVLTLMIFDYDLNIYAFVGVIMLIGIVKKNAIMMIDFALDAQRNKNMNAENAICNGALIRFRPIMMTTMAALMGSIPIAMGFGAGAESRRPLGLAVVGGLIFSQLLTLYITPVVYIYLDKIFTKKRAV